MCLKDLSIASPREEACRMWKIVGFVIVFLAIISLVSYDFIHDYVVIRSTLSESDLAIYQALKSRFDTVAREQCGHIGDGTLSAIVSERDKILKKHKISQRTKWIAYDVYEDNSGSKLAEAF